MDAREDDIYTEPDDIDPDTLSHLGPLSPMAGVFEGSSGVDVHPAADGAEHDAYVERIVLEPIDPQPNGPQLLYGLRYHTHIRKPGEVETFHDQVGYWLWDAATGTVYQTLTIPRGQTALAMGTAAPDARTFELVATLGSPVNGISSAPFLDRNFKTTEYRIKVTVHDADTWSYELDTTMSVRGRPEPFHHTDHHTLRRVAAATPNPAAAAEG